MNHISYFESRQGELTGTDEEVYIFVTDIRNFERFIPEGILKSWQADRESCSFEVSMLGKVTLSLSEKELNKKVVFKGDALKKNDFSLLLHISKNNNDLAVVKVSLEADLNPIIKMMAANPVNKFLEKLIGEMESFRDWKNIRE
jgi:carbon monoxide dehydrogenase subunit G